MSTIKWAAPESIVTYYTTELNSLGNGSFSAVGAAIANETDLFAYIDVELVLASLSPTVGAFVDIWLDATLDGTNYSDPGKVLQSSSLLATMGLDTTAATAQRIVISNIQIPPLGFKLQIRNGSGVAFAASANTFKYRRHNAQVV